ncbi:MAG TPA: hypothetical protein VMV49_09950 [Candidatus Deferrimicrobium sp.]|nr:hypothetical protein [Candidatus Deferrimicrobium sp.]
MELVTTAFKIAMDERYKVMEKKNLQVQDIIDEFRWSAHQKTSLLEIYNIFSKIIVQYWQEAGEEIATRIFDLLFKDWDLTPKIIACNRSRIDYLYNPEEDY